ncbi:MAG: FMN-binding negative transcriptional regulator [Aeromicrobium erythreum]
MRHHPRLADDDPETVRRLVRDNPWALLLSSTSEGLVASHYPFLLAEESEEAGSPLVLVTHVGRPDDQLHELGRGQECLVVVQGRHGYVSPSWYAPGASKAPTWNFSATHLYGVPEVLDDAENLRTLTRLVEHFERHVDEPMLLDPAWAEQPARGTVGLRIPVTRFVTKIKMSQDKDPQSVQNVIDHLRAPGPYSHPRLADDMERARSES